METLNKKVIEHYNWKFDYPSKCYFEPYEELPDTHHFKSCDLPDDTDEVKKALDYHKKAATVHRIARAEGRKAMIDGASYASIVKAVEGTILKCFKIDSMDYYKNIGAYENGIAFPVGLSVNNIMAHDTAVIDDARVLCTGDVVKLDIGVHCNGYIIDSAFTHVVEGNNEEENNTNRELYNPLLNATADATYSAIAMAGPDARLYEMSEIISEVINSYEVDRKPIKAVNGLGGHDILRHIVHGDHMILSVPHSAQEGMKMKNNCTYAIETYATTGYGEPTQHGDLSHFSFNREKTFNNKWYKAYCKRFPDGFNKWVEQRGTLPFSMSWLQHFDGRKLGKELKELIDTNIVTAYPPLVDTTNSKTSQLEHTIYVRDNGVEILSLGNDY